MIKLGITFINMATNFCDNFDEDEDDLWQIARDVNLRYIKNFVNYAVIYGKFT